ITAGVPLLPSSNPNLLDLPHGIEVEFIDLPGLKSVLDQTNLAVIQTRIRKSFCLVALDYSQVDNKQRKKLLKELKETVESLYGSTDSMIFVLNRVDHRSAEDLPLTERISQLKVEIKELLNLKEEPDIMPFSGLVLYYAQCAWGASPLSETSEIGQAERADFLGKMIEDCANLFLNHFSSTEQMDFSWFMETYGKINRKETIDDETTKKILRYSRKLSGGGDLWECMRRRVKQSFSILILYPALAEVFSSHSSLIEDIELIIRVRKIRQKDKVESELADINSTRQQLITEINAKREKFSSQTKRMIEELKKNDPDLDIKLEQEAKQKGRQGFSSLFDAINQVEGDLTQTLIAPLGDALKNKQIALDLQEDLDKVVSPTLARDLTHAYDHVLRKLEGFEQQSGVMRKRVPKKDKKAVEKMHDTERSVVRLYIAIRDALTARAQYKLQTQAKKIEEALQWLAEEEANELCDVCSFHLPLLRLDKSAKADFQKSLTQDSIMLSENFFQLTNPIKDEELSEKEIVGHEKRTEQTGNSCFNKEEIVEVPIKKDILYREITFPAPNTMMQQWSKGVGQEKEKLWSILCTWMTEHQDQIGQSFNKTIDDVLTLAESALKEQLNTINNNSEQQQQMWADIEELKTVAIDYRKELKGKTLSSVQ
ncbi:MAG: hypothetical protein AAFY76_01185, partial [Cyanobacteria bacterium J06649_11]